MNELNQPMKPASPTTPGFRSDHDHSGPHRSEQGLCDFPAGRSGHSGLSYGNDDPNRQRRVRLVPLSREGQRFCEAPGPGTLER
jgi:hypothetical protein